MLQFYHFYICQHFDLENKFLLLNFMWSLNFVVLDYSIRRYYSFYLFHYKPQVLFFLSFFVCRLFKDISVTILSFFEQNAISER